MRDRAIFCGNISGDDPDWRHGGLHVNTPVNEMDKVIQQNAAMARGGHSCLALAGEAEQLSDLVGQLRLGNVAQSKPTPRGSSEGEPIRSPKLGPGGGSLIHKRQLKVPAGQRVGRAQTRASVAEEGWHDF